MYSPDWGCPCPEHSLCPPAFVWEWFTQGSQTKNTSFFKKKKTRFRKEPCCYLIFSMVFFPVISSTVNFIDDTKLMWWKNCIFSNNKKNYPNFGLVSKSAPSPCWYFTPKGFKTISIIYSYTYSTCFKHVCYPAYIIVICTTSSYTLMQSQYISTLMCLSL